MRNAGRGESRLSHMAEVARGDLVELAPGSRRGRVLRRVFGPRIVDLPIRLLVMIVAVTGLLPGSFESDDPLYIVLSVIAMMSTVAATYIPTITAAVAVCLYLVFAFRFPELLNPYQQALLISSAILVSKFKWLRAALVIATLLGLTALAHGFTPLAATSFNLLLLSVIAYSVLAIALGLFELRIRREIELRERGAREHERKLQSERIGFAIDTHDTVSHGLATQGALIRLLSREQDERERHRLLGEFAMINGDTQLQLRALLARLGDVQEGRVPTDRDPGQELRQAAETLRSAAEVGGITLEVDLNFTGAQLAPATLDDVKLLMRELVTNMVKHSEGEGLCTLRGGVADGLLTLTSKNPASRVDAAIPRSLSTRSASLGGTCETRIEEGTFVVSLRIPLPGQDFPQSGDALSLPQER